MYFKYTVYSPEKKIIKGTMNVTGQAVAIEILERAGYQILSLKKTRKINLEDVFPSLFAVKKREVALFSRQLSMLLDKGVEFLTALRLVQQQVKNRLLKNRLDLVIRTVESGSSFSDAIARYPDVFPVTYHNLMKVGEKSGKLESVLIQVAEDMERDEVTSKKIRNAFIYPGVILLMGVVTTVVMITTVLPSMIDLFSQFGTELPLPTRITIAFADFLTSYGLYVLGVLIALFFFLVWYSKTTSGRYYIEKMVLSLPVMGRTILHKNLHQFCRIAAVLIGSGLTITEVIDVARQGVSSEGIRRELNKIPGYLTQGSSLARSMRESDLFPPMLIQMVVTGEETNTLESCFQGLSDHYEFEFSQSLSTFVSLLEPVLVAIVGLFIGFVAISAMMPIYSVYDVVF